ncbi:SGNH/GDSL hydrolase family protein [Streptomyces sp. DSM 44917]|uniref:SGNH/GDSL hydrolase family protein n=1 Tax=Streptomyces boetiae TaxID=3075541 RepID=A0ABU2LCH9_9ACTN|nr:SGNH/GDSL hydrolase family protein [Streptomyces sp. DSM 44917]MDT0309222.1 SGNH/GDSL hydrolase family protein [Streptomyces sp. DSM 44917]
MGGFEAGERYVALGSSFAAGPGIRPRRAGSPRRAGRSAANYASLVARSLGLDLTDVSFSGATAEEVLNGPRRGGPAQLAAITPRTRLVTVTCGGNDVGYVPRLTLASLPGPLRALPPVRRRVEELGEGADERFATLAETFDRLLAAVARRAPAATVLLVDYLPLLPPEEEAGAGPLSPGLARWGRETARRLVDETRAAAERGGCGYVAASAAGRAHHAWSDEPWTTRFRLGPGSPAPYHPNAAGMRAVAGLVLDALAAGSREPQRP